LFFYNEELEKFKKYGLILSNELKDEQEVDDFIKIIGQDWF
jgi:hypothetical protein